MPIVFCFVAAICICILFSCLNKIYYRLVLSTGYFNWYLLVFNLVLYSPYMFITVAFSGNKLNRTLFKIIISILKFCLKVTASMCCEAVDSVPNYSVGFSSQLQLLCPCTTLGGAKLLRPLNRNPLSWTVSNYSPFFLQDREMVNSHSHRQDISQKNHR